MFHSSHHHAVDREFLGFRGFRGFRRFRGFTIIELLVVISIIALLVGILLPALSLARESAKQAQSTSNTHQIALGLNMYAMENRGFFPSTGHTTVTWMERIGRPQIKQPGDFGTPAEYDAYVAEVNRMTKYVADPRAFRSPKDDTTFWETSSPTPRYTSYGINSYFAADHPPYYGVTFDNVNSPARSIIIAEYNDVEAWEDHFTPQFWGWDESAASPQTIVMDFVIPSDLANLPYPLNLWQLLEPGEQLGSSTDPRIDFSGDAGENWDFAEQRPKNLAFKRYQGKGIYGFVDGHAATHAFGETFAWDQSNPSVPATTNWWDPKARK